MHCRSWILKKRLNLKKKKSYFWMDIEHPNPSFHVLNLVGDGADGLYWAYFEGPRSKFSRSGTCLTQVKSRPDFHIVPWLCFSAFTFIPTPSLATEQNTQLYAPFIVYIFIEQNHRPLEYVSPFYYWLRLPKEVSQLKQVKPIRATRNRGTD